MEDFSKNVVFIFFELIKTVYKIHSSQIWVPSPQTTPHRWTVNISKTDHLQVKAAREIAEAHGHVGYMDGHVRGRVDELINLNDDWFW